MPIISSGSSTRFSASRTISSVTMRRIVARIGRGDPPGPSAERVARDPPVRPAGQERLALGLAAAVGERGLDRRDGAAIAVGDALGELPGARALRVGAAPPPPPGRARRRAGRATDSHVASSRSAVASPTTRRSRPSPPQSRDEADRGVHEAQLGVRRDDPPVACQGHLGAAADGMAVHERDGGHRQRREPVEDRAAAIGELLAAVLERVELADRCAGAERAAGAGERDQADVSGRPRARRGSPPAQPSRPYRSRCAWPGRRA